METEKEEVVVIEEVMMTRDIWWESSMLPCS